MHELPVINKIMEICLQHAEKNNAKKILSIDLKVGALSDLQPEWMQRYFNYVSKDTIASGAKLVIEETPIIYRCNQCSTEFELDLSLIRKPGEIACPECAAEKVSLVSGKEYLVHNMAVI